MVNDKGTKCWLEIELSVHFGKALTKPIGFPLHSKDDFLE